MSDQAQKKEIDRKRSKKELASTKKKQKKQNKKLPEYLNPAIVLSYACCNAYP